MTDNSKNNYFGVAAAASSSKRSSLVYTSRKIVVVPYFGSKLSYPLTDSVSQDTSTLYSGLKGGPSSNRRLVAATELSQPLWPIAEYDVSYGPEVPFTKLSDADFACTRRYSSKEKSLGLEAFISHCMGVKRVSPDPTQVHKTRGKFSEFAALHHLSNRERAHFHAMWMEVSHTRKAWQTLTRRLAVFRDKRPTRPRSEDIPSKPVPPRKEKRSPGRSSPFKKRDRSRKLAVPGSVEPPAYAPRTIPVLKRASSSGAPPAPDLLTGGHLLTFLQAVSASLDDVQLQGAAASQPAFEDHVAPLSVMFRSIMQQLSEVTQIDMENFISLQDVLNLVALLRAADKPAAALAIIGLVDGLLVQTITKGTYQYLSKLVSAFVSYLTSDDDHGVWPDSESSVSCGSFMGIRQLYSESVGSDEDPLPTAVGEKVYHQGYSDVREAPLVNETLGFMSDIIGHRWFPEEAKATLAFRSADYLINGAVKDMDGLAKFAGLVSMWADSCKEFHQTGDIKAFFKPTPETQCSGDLVRLLVKCSTLRTDQDLKPRELLHEIELMEMRVARLKSKNPLIQRQLGQLVENKMMIMRTASQIRQQPAGFVISGAPGLGKTYIASRMEFLYKKMKDIEDGVSVAHYWQDTAHQEPPSKVAFLIFNDFFSIKDEKCLVPTMSLGQQVTDTSPFSIPSASIAAKHASFLSHEYTIFTTNATSFTCSQSVSGCEKWNRRYVNVLVEEVVPTLVNGKPVGSYKPNNMRYTVWQMCNPVGNKLFFNNPPPDAQKFYNETDLLRYMMDGPARVREQEKPSLCDCGFAANHTGLCWGAPPRIPDPADAVHRPPGLNFEESSFEGFSSVDSRESRSLVMKGVYRAPHREDVRASASETDLESRLPNLVPRHAGPRPAVVDSADEEEEMSVSSMTSSEIADMSANMGNFHAQGQGVSVDVGAPSVDRLADSLGRVKVDVGFRPVSRSTERTLKNVGLAIAGASAFALVVISITAIFKLNKVIFNPTPQPQGGLVTRLPMETDTPSIVRPADSASIPWVNPLNITHPVIISREGGWRMYASFLLPTVLMFPKHMLEKGFGEITVAYRGSVYRFPPQHCWSHPTEDLCLMPVPGVKAVVGCLYAWLPETNPVLSYEPGLLTEQACTISTLNLGGRFVYSYDLDTQDGDCGRILATKSGKILGFHIGYIKNPKLAVATAVSIQRLKPGLDYLRANGYVCEQISTEVPVTIQGANAGMHPSSDASWVNTNQFDIAQADHVAISHLSSVFKPRMTCRLTTDCATWLERAPQMTRPPTGKAKPCPDGVWRSVDTHRLENMRAIGQVSHSLGMDAVMYALEEIPVPKTRLYPLSFVQSITGSDINDMMNPRDVTKGIGYTLRTKGLTKQTAYVPIVGQDGAYTVHPMVREEYNRILTAVKADGPIPVNVVEATLKDEAISVAKAELRKGRYFYVCDHAGNLAIRSYLLPLLAYMMEMPESSATVTLNCGSSQWGRLLSHLTQGGPDLLAADMSHYDLSHNAMQDLYVTFMERLALRCGYTPDEARIVRRLVYMTTRYFLLMSGDFFFCSTALCSGLPDTIHRNCVILKLLTYGAQLTKVREAPSRHLRCSFTGDDSLIGFLSSKGITGAEFQEHGATCGYVITDSEDKTKAPEIRHFSKVSYLKRSFVLRPDNRVLAPIEKASIYKSLVYLVQIKPEEERARNVNASVSAVREMWMHGREAFDELRSECQAVFPEAEYPSYETLELLFVSDGLQTWLGDTLGL